MLTAQEEGPSVAERAPPLALAWCPSVLLFASPRLSPLFLGPLESSACHPFPQRIVFFTEEEMSWPYQISGFKLEHRVQ